MRIPLAANWIGTAAVALGLGAAALAATPEAAADTGRSDAAGRSDSAQRPAGANRRGPSAAAAVDPVPPPVTTAPRATAKAAAAQPRLRLNPTVQGVHRLRGGGADAAELSGITYAGGSSYYAVGDNGAPRIWQIAAEVNATFGRLASSAIAGGIEAPGMGRDSEGIALRPGTDTVWVTDEIDSTITEFSLSTGEKVGAVAVPGIYRPANVRNNMGLESLSYGAGKLWTANEEALVPDGPLSTTVSGSWVRIQEFGGQDFAPATQYAYRTDRIAGMSPFISVERSGLVDLLALPDGRVLALERQAGGFFPHFRSRIYQLDFSGATDVSEFPGLADGGFTAVRKRLLWQGVFLSDNFEGITLGPRLNNGAYSVLLISDDGSGDAGQRQDLYSLVLFGLQEAPASSAVVV